VVTVPESWDMTPDAGLFPCASFPLAMKIAGRYADMLSRQHQEGCGAKVIERLAGNLRRFFLERGGCEDR
jgi:hypothetical protein